MNSFFHSAYTSEGFKAVKLNSYNPDCFRYIIKGYSDTAKEKMINKIKEKLINENYSFSLSRNFNGRLTGIMCEQKGFILCDGTVPFEETATTFGATDGIISLEGFQNSGLIREKSESIVSLLQRKADCERRCCRFLNAAAGINKDKRCIGKDTVDSRKISRYSAKLWSSFGYLPSGKVGIEKNVFLSVITASGQMSVWDEVGVYCDTVIVIDDAVGYCSEMIIDRIRRYALSSGVDVISCRSFLDFNGVPEHIILPALRVGIFSKVKESFSFIDKVKKVRAKRFALKDMGESNKVRLQFNQRAMASLLKEAEASLKIISECDRELDDIYSAATDEETLVEFTYSRIYNCRSLV